MFAYDYKNKFTLRVWGSTFKPALFKELLRLGVKVLDRTEATALLTSDRNGKKHGAGACAMDVRTGKFYILRAKGDSMVDAGIDEDDLLVIERNCPALEGDIVVALDEDNQNTLKRYAGYDEDSGYYILEYENEARYPGKAIKVRSFQVQGVARHVIKSL